MLRTMGCGLCSNNTFCGSGLCGYISVTRMYKKKVVVLQKQCFMLRSCGIFASLDSQYTCYDCMTQEKENLADGDKSWDAFYETTKRICL